MSLPRRSLLKYLLLTAAVLIAGGSLIVSHYFVRDLAEGERINMQIWAEAMRSLNDADEQTDLSLVLKVINGNRNIPVIVQDSHGHIITYRNIDVDTNDKTEEEQTLKRMAQVQYEAGYYMRMELKSDVGPNSDYLLITYGESSMLRRLASYPYVLLGVISLFFVLAITAILSAKRAEQNKVWVGLSKETAHQLGTPISSLMAWVEILKENHPNDPLIPEMDKDVQRLQLIAERFSKIGSTPEMTLVSLRDTLHRVALYIARRAPRGITVVEHYPDEEDIAAQLNPALFEWVIENLCKNAIDAISHHGTITLRLHRRHNKLLIDITDTGKGIAKKDFKTVFTPGYTTKARGWGLGLSLVKRIVEEYHHGTIYVHKSEVGQGTTFRIILNA